MSIERRNAVISAALVGTVVAVIGFGAGLSSLFSSGSGAAGAGPTSSGDIGSVAPAGSAPVSSPATAADSSGLGGATSAVAYRSATTGGATGWSASGSSISATGAALPMPEASAAGASGSSSGSMGAMSSSSTGSGGTCSNEILVNAMLDPFINHIYRAHLERSPGQQANDLLNVNQYVLTHTVLLEDMVAPAITALQNSFNGVVPFTNHMYRAHLERSPGQQVNDALNVNQYVTTHTVLVEDMTAPAVYSFEGSYGC